MTHALMGTALAKKMPDDTRSMSTPSASSASGNSLVSLHWGSSWMMAHKRAHLTVQLVLCMHTVGLVSQS